MSKSAYVTQSHKNPTLDDMYTQIWTDANQKLLVEGIKQSKEATESLTAAKPVVEKAAVETKSKSKNVSYCLF